MTVPVRYPVMVIGGAEDKVNQRTILSAFFESAGGAQAKIGIIPCASREPRIVGDRYYQIFKQMGAEQVQILDIRHRSECDEARWLDILSSCSGVFVTGGDQLRLCDMIADTDLIRNIRDGVESGKFSIAGTSAGAAIMGEAMIAGGSSGESPNPALVELTQGLSIVPELLVDQHFHNRNRMARLLSAIAAHPGKLGVGIDEDTCAALEGNGIFQVLGKGCITIVDPGDLTHTNHANVSGESPLSLHSLKIHILSQGDRYDYRNRRVFSHSS